MELISANRGKQINHAGSYWSGDSLEWGLGFSQEIKVRLVVKLADPSHKTSSQGQGALALTAMTQKMESSEANVY